MDRHLRSFVRSFLPSLLRSYNAHSRTTPLVRCHLGAAAAAAAGGFRSTASFSFLRSIASPSMKDKSEAARSAESSFKPRNYAEIEEGVLNLMA